ncbi:unnamed protein product, partial [Staurois parvus]
LYGTSVICHPCSIWKIIFLLTIFANFSFALSRNCTVEMFPNQGWTDHLETRALPEGPGSVGGPMRCPWYLS